jgi:hypothetical protein
LLHLHKRLPPQAPTKRGDGCGENSGRAEWHPGVVLQVEAAMKTNVLHRSQSRRTLRYGATLGVLLVTGCVATQPYPLPPESELMLLSAAAPAIPHDCAPAPGVVYRTSFEVQTDGTVAGATPASGDGCVQLALQQWVSTFRYQPVSREIPSVIDWMQVTAARGR